MFLQDHYTIFFLVCIVLSTLQCVSETAINLPFEGNALTIVCHPSPGTPIRASLGVSSAVTENDIFPEGLLPAITILEGDNSIDVLRPFPVEPGMEPYWEGKSDIATGSSYSINVVTPGYPAITAHTTIPFPIIPKIKVSENNIPPVIVGDKVIQQFPLTFSLENIAATDSFFVFNIQFFKLNTVGGDSRISTARLIAQGTTGAYLHNTPDNSWLIEKKYWSTTSGATFQINVAVEYMAQFEEPEKLVIEWRTVSREYYLYYLSLSRQGTINLPFSDPDVLFNNIQGGYGTFSGFSKDTIEIPL